MSNIRTALIGKDKGMRTNLPIWLTLTN